MGTSWLSAVAEAEFTADGHLTKILNGWHALIARVEGRYCAINDRCPHAASRLSKGMIRRGAVICPLHGARYELASGRCIGGAYRDIRTFPTRVTDGMIEIEVPNSAPRADEVPV